MTGIDQLNFPAFDKARDKLKGWGHDVVSPADLERNRSVMTYEEALKDDLKYMLTCDTIYMLKGWENSNGARLEKMVAQSLSMRVMYEPTASRYLLLILKVGEELCVPKT